MKRLSRGKRLAVRAASLSDHRKRVGACLVRKNKVVSIGCNNAKTHPGSKSWQRTQHAEFDCLYGLTRAEAVGGVLFVARLLKNDELAISKPCPSCAELIAGLGIRDVWYVNREGLWTNE
jgi:deoxycytidylate deaminase